MDKTAIIVVDRMKLTCGCIVEKDYAVIGNNINS